MIVYVLVDRNHLNALGIRDADAIERTVVDSLRMLVRRRVVSHPGGKGPGAAFWTSFYILCPGIIWPLFDAQLMADMWNKDLIEYEWEDTMILPILEAAPAE